MKLTILLDLDNVCANLMKKWLYAYNTKFDDNLTTEDIQQWDAHVYAKKCSPQEYYSLIDEPDFFSDLEVIADSQEIVEKLHKDGHKIYFVTATPLGNKTASYDKCMWVDKYFSYIGKNNLIQTHNKNLIMGDLLFDDSPHNLNNFHSIKVAMDMPYNRQAKTDYRAKTWSDFYKIIEEIITKGE